VEQIVCPYHNWSYGPRREWHGRGPRNGAIRPRRFLPANDFFRGSSATAYISSLSTGPEPLFSFAVFIGGKKRTITWGGPGVSVRKRSSRVRKTPAALHLTGQHFDRFHDRRLVAPPEKIRLSPRPAAPANGYRAEGEVLWAATGLDGIIFGRVTAGPHG